MSPVRDGSSVEDEVWPVFTGAPGCMGVLDLALGEGVPLGTTREGRPATVTLLRPAPVRVVVLGQAWLASLLALRAALLGAGVVVVTERPAPWHLLVRAVGGNEPFAAVVPPGAAVGGPSPGVTSPVLTLHDGGAGAEAALARAPWQTSVHLLFRIGGQPAAVLDTADLVLVPQVPAEEAEAVTAALRLPAGLAVHLAGLGPAEVLAATRSRTTVVTVQASPTEQSVLRAGDLGA